MPNSEKATLRPHALASGGKLGVVGLASRADDSLLREGCTALQQVSGRAVESITMERDGDFAGSADARAMAFLTLWQRGDVEAIVCARGGYGSNYLCPWLCQPEQQLILRQTPKIFVGYSDNTSVLLALDRAGLVGFHGPMVASDFAGGRADAASFLSALGGLPLEFSFDAASNVQCLVGGEAQGPIIGGCLSVVVSSLGTPWEIETAGRILFLEDINEKPYRIDRMIMHLAAAGKLDHVRGIIFGEMPGCTPGAQGEESLRQTIERLLGDLGVPLVMGFSSGHGDSPNLTLPFGVEAALAAGAGGVRLQVEPAAVRGHKR
jgi:muramoyltetrapeptide carboxypeptidase